MDFPYTKNPAQCIALPSFRLVHRPVLNVLIRKNGRAVTAKSIVDSGADVCIFPASMAKVLGIRLPNERSWQFSGTAETPQVAYFETVQATIWNRDATLDPITFDLDAGFCQTLEHIGLGLLGQEGFFSRFKVSFDQANGLFSVT